MVRAYVWAVIVVATASVAWSGESVPGFSVPVGLHNAVIGITAFVVLGLLLQLAEYRLSVAPASGSISFIVYLAAALVFGGSWGALITAATLGMAQALAKKRPLRIAFNVAQVALAVVVAAEVYDSFGGSVPPSFDHVPLLGFGGMVVAFVTINSTAVSGVIAISEGQPFDEVWLRNTWSWVGYDLVASTLALGVAFLYERSGVAGMALVVAPILFMRHAYFVNVQLQATNRELLELMVKAIEARDPYTSGHSQRVSELARALANDMGIRLREVDNIATAALLHDVGKIYEEFAPILRKEGKLTPEERAIMDSHPLRSAELVGTISNLRGYVMSCIRHHHESFDGSGYPDGLAGDAIPVGARIILVADTTDAMTTDRPYRKALALTRVLEELDKHAGRQFDPQVVAAFKRSGAVRRLVGAEQKPQAVAPAFSPAQRRGQLAAR